MTDKSLGFIPAFLNASSKLCLQLQRGAALPLSGVSPLLDGM
jgi:hypothetical protein